MRDRFKSLRALLDFLQSQVRSGKLKPEVAQNYQDAFRRFCHATRVGDTRRMAKTADEIARLFLKNI